MSHSRVKSRRPGKTNASAIGIREQPKRHRSSAAISRKATCAMGTEQVRNAKISGLREGHGRLGYHSAGEHRKGDIMMRARLPLADPIPLALPSCCSIIVLHCHQNSIRLLKGRLPAPTGLADSLRRSHRMGLIAILHLWMIYITP